MVVVSFLRSNLWFSPLHGLLNGSVVDGLILHSRSRLQFAIEPGGEAEFVG